MTTNYFNTLVLIADDSPTDTSVVPNLEKQSVASQQFRMIYDNPYEFTSDDVIFARVAEKDGIRASEIPAAQEDYFRTGRACMRTSPLAKSHGWGIHHNEDGKIALVAAESDTYRHLLNDESVTKVKAMRRSRA